MGLACCFSPSVYPLFCILKSHLLIICTPRRGLSKFVSLRDRNNYIWGNISIKFWHLKVHLRYTKRSKAASALEYEHGHCIYPSVMSIKYISMWGMVATPWFPHCQFQGAQGSLLLGRTSGASPVFLIPVHSEQRNLQLSRKKRNES